MDKVLEIAGEDDCRKVEVVQERKRVVLWQENDQPTSDAVWLTSAMARQLRDQLNKMEL